jgi:MFS family permease
MVGHVALLMLGYLYWPGEVTDMAFLVAGGLMATSVAITVVGVREPSPAVWAAAAEGGGQGIWASLRALARYRGAVMFFLVAFTYWSGVNAVLPLVSVYTRDILDATVGEAQLLPALLLVATTVCALPAAWLGRRLGARRVLALGFVLITIAALAALAITTKEQGAAVFLLAGVGNAAWNVLAVPLLAELVPRAHIGAATGFLAASGSLAAPLASLVAGALADVYGPRAIFALMAVLVVVALALLPTVHGRTPTYAVE